MHLSFTAGFRYIEIALSERRKTFATLEQEMSDFKPRPLSDFEERRVSMRQRLHELNPTMSDESLDDFVNPQIEVASSERFQSSNAFSGRFMIEQVAITLLSHALCEALINAIIALGLAHNKAETLFPLIEKAEMKEKWAVGPRCFHPTYDLPKSSHLYQKLNFLCKQRNALVHYKITLHIDDKKVLNGSNLKRLSFQESAVWVNRFLRLPYELHTHALSQILEPPILGLLQHDLNV